MYIIAISEAEVIKEKAKPAHEKRSMDINEDFNITLFWFLLIFFLKPVPLKNGVSALILLLCSTETHSIKHIIYL